MRSRSLTPSRIVELICASVVLPIALGYIVYFGFFSAIMRGTFTPQSQDAQLSQSVFRYRVLGPALFRAVRPQLSKLAPQHARPIDDLIHAADPQGDPKFYFALYAFNTAFMCLGGCALWVLFRGIKPPSGIADALAIVTSLALIAISQFVITVYDTPSYFLLLAGMVVALMDFSIVVKTILLTSIVFVGTATRETACLILSFAATIYYLRNGLAFRATLTPLACATTAFILVYAGLRLAMGGSAQVAEGIDWRKNLAFGGLCALGVFVAVSALVFAVADARTRRALLVYFATASPYILFIFTIGWGVEVRLWIPVLLGAIVIASWAPFIQERRVSGTATRP